MDKMVFIKGGKWVCFKLVFYFLMFIMCMNKCEVSFVLSVGVFKSI